MKAKNFDGYDSVFARRFQSLFDENKDTQSNLSKATGIARQTVSMYYNGQTIPTADKLRQIAEYFGVSADYLLGLTDIKSTDTEIQAVCDYTGLKETAVHCLHQYLNSETSAFDDKCFDILNELLDEGSPLYEIINSAAISRHLIPSEISQINNCIDLLNESGSEDNEKFEQERKRFIEQMYHSFYRTGTNIRVMYYEAKEAAGDLTKNVFYKEGDIGESFRRLENAYAKKYRTSILLEKEGEPHAND